LVLDRVGHAVDDDDAPAVRRPVHRVHPRRHPARGARPHPLPPGIRGVPAARADAAAVRPQAWRHRAPREGGVMAARVDAFCHAYANFADEVLARIRAETYGHDIGQNSWVTVDEYEGYVESLGLNEQSSVLEVASGSGGPALYLAGRCGCHVVGIDV